MGHNAKLNADSVVESEIPGTAYCPIRDLGRAKSAHLGAGREVGSPPFSGRHPVGQEIVEDRVDIRRADLPRIGRVAVTVHQRDIGRVHADAIPHVAELVPVVAARIEGDPDSVAVVVALELRVVVVVDGLVRVERAQGAVLDPQIAGERAHLHSLRVRVARGKKKQKEERADFSQESYHLTKRR